MTSKKQLSLYQLYQILLAEMGYQGDWPAKSKEEIIIGAILVQNTRWENVQLSLVNLQNRLQDFKKLPSLRTDELQNLIRPTGFYKNKSRSLEETFIWLSQHRFDYERIAQIYGHQLRRELLKIFGIGQETADVLLLYVFDQPVFIADKYAQKLFGHLTQQTYKTYTSLAKATPPLNDFSLAEAQQFHILIDEFGKQYFRKQDSFSESFLKNFKQ